MTGGLDFFNNCKVTKLLKGDLVGKEVTILKTKGKSGKVEEDVNDSGHGWEGCRPLQWVGVMYLQYCTLQ